MPFQMLFKFLPDIAIKETRSLLVRDGGYKVPVGDYGFCEMFCDEKGCDCRRVVISVNDSNWKTMALIGYGWESRLFYRKWFRSMRISDEELKAYMGPNHHDGIRPSEYSDFFLSFFRNELIKDKDYIDRIIRHYYLVRDIVENKKEQY